MAVGGLSADQARHRINAKLVDPLDKPVTVTFEGKKYVLSPDRLQLRADINGMVDEALSASRSGGFPTRVWRYATGGTVDREIAPQISYSADALDGFVDEVAKQIDRAPQDASVAPTPTSLNPVAGQDGVTVLTGTLRSRLRAAIDSPRHRTVSPAIKRLKPEVTTGRPGPEVSGVPDHRPGRLPASAVEEPEGREDLHDRGRPGRPRDPGRASTRSTTSRSTRPGTCPTLPGPATSRAR